MRAWKRTVLAAKVPEITVMFWFIKVLTTGMGEAASDYLGEKNLVIAAVIGLGGLILAMWLQLQSIRYETVTYWFAVAMVAVFGTMAADVVHVVGVPYEGSTLFYAAALTAVLLRWRKREGTLSIHSILTPRRETYYWLTVLCTFALGTAAGDFTADQLQLGYAASVALFFGLILIPLLAWWRLGLNETAAFWSAYVLTRPLGASVADWFGKPSDRSGLGCGDGTVTFVLLLLIVVLVARTKLMGGDVQPARTARSEHAQSHRRLLRRAR